MVKTFVLLAITLALCCKPSAPEQNKEINSETITQKEEKMPQEPMEKATSKKYILATSGLNIRESVNPKSKILGNIPYAELVEIEQQNSGEKLNYENIEGTMVPINFKEISGYVFSGFLSSIPVPDKTVKYRDKMITVFLSRLKDASMNFTDSVSVKKEYKQIRHLSIPSSSFQETFLIAKILFYIPAAYHFPIEDKVVLSTPSNPSEAALNGNYTHISQSFEIKRKPNGEIHRLSYFNDNEVGGQNLFFEKREAGFLITVEEFSH